MSGTRSIPAGSPLVEAMSWPQVAEHLGRGGLAIVPVGSTEQHGRHLPLGTDTLIATGLALAAAPRIDGIVWPALSYGFRSQPNTGGGEAFPGTTGIPGDTFSGHLADLIRALRGSGAQRIVVVNAHYENAWFVTDAIERALTPPGGEARVVSVRWGPLLSASTLAAMAPDGEYDLAREHGGIGETSLMLELCPELVGDAAGAKVAPPAPGYEAFPQPNEPPPHDGVLSSAAGASAEIGRAIVGDFLSGLEDAVEREFGEQ